MGWLACNRFAQHGYLDTSYKILNNVTEPALDAGSGTMTSQCTPMSPNVDGIQVPTWDCACSGYHI
jgi:hypothetical protein